MKIGVDLRVLQGGHQFRGIGEVAKQTLDRMFAIAVAQGDDVEFVMFRHEGNDPKKLLTIPKGLKYREEFIPAPADQRERSKAEKLREFIDELYGNPLKVKGVDVFLQYDYAMGVPTSVKSVLVKHDIIPYLFWNHYFDSAKRHFKNKAARTTLRVARHNYKYLRVLKHNLHNATHIVCVSDNTRKDLHEHFHVSNKKMSVVHLGASVKAAKSVGANGQFVKPAKPYLLWVGAGDARRRVVDLVHAYNNLKARGHDIQLVLAGENFQSPEKIPNVDVRKAVMGSSYKKDILTVGYINDQTKHELYKNALAFVFTTAYEGFGIPVLESMLLDCPIIAYDNSSIPEIGGEHALYANNWQDVERLVIGLMNQAESDRKEKLAAAKKHAETFTWEKTGQGLYDRLLTVGGYKK